MNAAIEVLGSVEAADHWMNLPNLGLGNKCPLDMMETDENAAALRQVLTAIETGGVA